MKKPASDQMSHERRYQQRKREEAARKPLKKIAPATSAPASPSNPAPPAGSSSSS
jgi:hypothetical protein